MQTTCTFSSHAGSKQTEQRPFFIIRTSVHLTQEKNILSYGCQSPNMRVNSSSGVSVLSSLLCFSNSSLYPPIITCFDYTSSSGSLMAFTVTSCVLVLPLCTLILWMGVQRRRQQGSVNASPACDSDVFIYHIVTMDIIGVVGMVFFCGAIYACSPAVVMLGYYCIFLSYPGQTFFQCLTCVERYLAVVHPITYRGLKTAAGAKVRNGAIGGAWLLSFALLSSVVSYSPGFPSVLVYVAFAIVTFVIYFCSLSVLFVLIRLGLWKVGGAKERVDKSKQRAFGIVAGVMAALLFRLSGSLFFSVVSDSEAGFERSKCTMLMGGTWLCLPSSLILPLLFLHRAGTRTGSTHN